MFWSLHCQVVYNTCVLSRKSTISKKFRKILKKCFLSFIILKCMSLYGLETFTNSKPKIHKWTTIYIHFRIHDPSTNTSTNETNKNIWKCILSITCIVIFTLVVWTRQALLIRRHHFFASEWHSARNLYTLPEKENALYIWIKS